MSHVVDSSVWVALFLDFDTQHKKAEHTLQKLSGTIYVPYCVISEVVTILAYKHSKQLADNFIAYTHNNKDLKIINDDARDEMDFYKTPPHKVSFVDSSLIFLAGTLNTKLVTFDKQLERAAKRSWNHV